MVVESKIRCRHCTDSAITPPVMLCVLEGKAAELTEPKDNTVDQLVVEFRDLNRWWSRRCKDRGDVGGLTSGTGYHSRSAKTE